MYEILFMVAMCWNLYLWMLVEARLATVYSELPTAVDNGKVANGKTSPEHFNPGRIVSIKPDRIGLFLWFIISVHYFSKEINHFYKTKYYYVFQQ